MGTEGVRSIDAGHGAGAFSFHLHRGSNQRLALFVHHGAVYFAGASVLRQQWDVGEQEQDDGDEPTYSQRNMGVRLHGLERMLKQIM